MPGRYLGLPKEDQVSIPTLVERVRRWRIFADRAQAKATMTPGRLTELCRRIGVTRVASSTLLDRIGIPTAYAVRPTALHPSAIFSSGKGMSQMNAGLTAVFESYERWSAERSYFRFIATTKQVAQQAGVLDFRLIVPEEIDEDREYGWSLGKDLVDNRILAMPSDWVEFPPANRIGGRSTTTGLAAHTDIGQAITSGLLECIERHHTARLEVEALKRVDALAAGPSLCLLERFAANNIEVHCFLLAATAACVVVYCFAFDHALRFPQAHCSGFAAAVDPQQALMKALLEIAQGRAAFASGLRDDVVQAVRPKAFGDTDDTKQLLWLKRLRTVSAQATPKAEAPMQARETCVALKTSAAVDTIACFPLRQIFDYPAVRIIAPELDDCD